MQSLWIADSSRLLASHDKSISTDQNPGNCDIFVEILRI